MPRAEADWQVFNLDFVEDALVTILNGKGITANGKRSTAKRKTPCVELNLQTQAVQGQRFTRFPSVPSALVQPYDTWTYELKVQCFTDRTVNGTYHPELVGRVRALLQYGWLTLTFTETVSPYHSITDIRESSAPTDFLSDDNLDVTELTFTGMLNVRAEAWPIEFS